MHDNICLVMVWQYTRTQYKNNFLFYAVIRAYTCPSRIMLYISMSSNADSMLQFPSSVQYWRSCEFPAVLRHFANLMWLRHGLRYTSSLVQVQVCGKMQKITNNNMFIRPRPHELKSSDFTLNYYKMSQHWYFAIFHYHKPKLHDSVTIIIYI